MGESAKIVRVKRRKVKSSVARTEALLLSHSLTLSPTANAHLYLACESVIGKAKRNLVEKLYTQALLKRDPFSSYHTVREREENAIRYPPFEVHGFEEEDGGGGEEEDGEEEECTVFGLIFCVRKHKPCLPPPSPTGARGRKRKEGSESMTQKSVSDPLRVLPAMW